MKCSLVILTTGRLPQAGDFKTMLTHKDITTEPIDTTKDDLKELKFKLNQLGMVFTNISIQLEEFEPSTLTIS